MPYKDKEKKKEAQRKWYLKNKKTHYENTRIHRRAYTERMQKLADDYKSEKGCCNCTEIDPICLDFHHPDDNKETTVSAAICQGLAEKKVVAEIEKCIVICANCHRKLHGNQRLK
tara:strand:+ start:11759 stop:12103 length:345 start_codon:yes stop_codon:yes gene_type:complete